MKLHLGSSCLAGLLLAALTLAPRLPAQDDAPPQQDPKAAATQPPQDSALFIPKAMNSTERAAKDRQEKAARLESELRFRLNNTVWNDLDLRAGDPGQVWMLRPARKVGDKLDRAWYLNDEKGLPRVGSWDLKDGEILFKAMDGTLMGRGKFNADDETISGRFISAQGHREYGQFKLREETKRTFRALTIRREEPRRRR